MKKSYRKVIGLFLACTLVIMPVRIAFADSHNPAGVGHSAVNAMEHGSASHPQAAASHNHGQHQAMIGSACDAPCNPSDTAPDLLLTDTTDHAGGSSQHCSSGTHCCVALLEATFDATHTAPYTPRSTLSITLTSIIIPTATKPPRHSLSG
jgi:hypothetical protein